VEVSNFKFSSSKSEKDYYSYSEFFEVSSLDSFSLF